MMFKQLRIRRVDSDMNGDQNYTRVVDLFSKAFHNTNCSSCQCLTCMNEYLQIVPDIWYVTKIPIQNRLNSGIGFGLG